jgi:N-methylhydantoinase A/oxoprolinase/acetone carboxylase beta subunit
MIGIDVGGTFTDFVLYDTDARSTSILKVDSGADASTTVVEGIRRICSAAAVDAGQLDYVIHGTTVATNALLQYDGACVGLVTTEGFRDVLHIGRHQRPQNYSILQDIPWQARPLVPRRRRLVVKERLAPPDGRVLAALDPDEVLEAARQLAGDGVDAIAVCFLFSYLDGQHERQAAELVRTVLPDAFVCTSHEVVPQFREFERFTTTAINAFVGPAVSSYIGRLASALAESGVGAPLHVMQSNGGTASPDAARRRPVTLLLSGPVGGIMGGIWSAGVREDASSRYLVTIDVGGTSADIGVVTGEGLVEARARDTWIAGYPVIVPMIDIETIGAGGGSIASIDSAGALHVGPRSAGATPGPAAYGRGGVEPTLTDANVVLGRFPRALAGYLDLDRDLAVQAVELIAEPLSLSVEEAALGIVRIVNENMAAAVRMKTVQRGLDPRECLLVALGGAGPLQAVELARILEIPEVLVPSFPGVTSAAGLLTSDLRYDVSRSHLRRLDLIDVAELEAGFRDGEHELRERLAADGCAEADVSIERAIDLRYHGQSHELKVPVPSGEVTAGMLAEVRVTFDNAHRAEFGHNFPELDVELVNARLTAVGRLPHLMHPEVSGATLDDAHIGDVETAFAVDGRPEHITTPVYERELLPLETNVPGPAIIAQLDSTTLVPPGASVRRDTTGNLLVRV